MLRQDQKWPRRYAAEILELKTKKERREALAKCPEEFRDLIAKHVEIAFALRKNRR
tara:strand:- start:1547 stop:1714 length:168 start_codon:yes stop_codon:yes gene_type:complete